MSSWSITITLLTSGHSDAMYFSIRLVMVFIVELIYSPSFSSCIHYCIVQAQLSLPFSMSDCPFHSPSFDTPLEL